MSSSLRPKPNLLFLSYGEDLLQNKILQNQFSTFVRSFDSSRYRIHVHSVFPISRTRLFKNSQWHKDLQLLQSSFEAKGMHFSFSTLPALANWLYSNFVQFFLFHHLYFYVKLSLIVKNQHIDYVYCRGYHSALVANLIKKYVKKDLKVHFDPRSMFIEEGLYLKKFGFFSLKLWRKIERFIYQNSDLVTFVSEPFERQMDEHFKIKKSLIIYTHADLEKFLSSKNASVKPIKFCYLGQLDDVGWHRTEYLLQLFKTLSKRFDSQFLIVTQSNHDNIRAQVDEAELSNRVVVTQASNATEVSKLLEPCHFAVMSYRPSVTDIEESIAATVVASKSGEYLAAGLPMICNKQLRGIADLLERYGVGATYEIGQEAAVVEDVEQILANYSTISAKCREVAKNHFDLKKNVKMIEDEIEKLCVP